MKRTILFALLVCLTSIGICKANQQISISPRTTPSPHPRAPARNYINAYIDGDYLYMNFDVPIGVATIVITDKTGVVVYQQQVDTYTSLNLIIPIDILDGGSYTITVQYGGTTATGEMDI